MTSFDGEDHENDSIGRASPDASSKMDARKLQNKKAGGDRLCSRVSEAEEDSFVSDRDMDVDADEKEYAELFARGIYYTHMSFSELSSIAEDVSPSTGCLYVPEQVLQKALWSGMEFRNTIQQSNDREINEDELDEPPNKMLESGLTVKEDALCDLELAMGLESFRQDFFAGTSFATSLPATPLKGLKTLRREHPSPGGARARRRPSNMNIGSELLAGGLSKKSIADKRFFPVPVDDTLRLGDPLGMLVINAAAARESFSALHPDSLTNLYDASSAVLGATGVAGIRDPYTIAIPSARRENNGRIPGQKPMGNYFGFGEASLLGRELAEKSVAADTVPVEPPFAIEDHIEIDIAPRSGNRKDRDEGSDDEVVDPALEMWLPYEPMRIGVDFWGIDKLPERNRLYSPTFFYAGSLWNLYVQTMRKPKGVQLGIYLHRQNPAEPLPPASAPPSEAARAAASSTRVSAPSLDQLLNESLNLAPAGLHSDTVGSANRANRTSTGNNSNLAPDEQPPTVPATMPAMPYRDPRKGIRAFFSIYCASPFGNAMTRFSSRPDQFTLSQSWGWKSSSLLGTVYLADGHIEYVRSESANRFRCICTIGLV